jgi:hypothetical protein
LGDSGRKSKGRRNFWFFFRQTKVLESFDSGKRGMKGMLGQDITWILACELKQISNTECRTPNVEGGAGLWFCGDQAPVCGCTLSPEPISTFGVRYYKKPGHSCFLYFHFQHTQNNRKYLPFINKFYL